MFIYSFANLNHFLNIFCLLNLCWVKVSHSYGYIYVYIYIYKYICINIQISVYV